MLIFIYLYLLLLLYPQKEVMRRRRTTPDENALCFSVERTQRKVGRHANVTQLASKKMNRGVWLNHTLLS
jgi:hypothetical protein